MSNKSNLSNSPSPSVTERSAQIHLLLETALMHAWARHESTKPGEWGNPANVYFSVQKAVEALTPVVQAHVETLSASLQPQWQPIETAPKDGMPILIFAQWKGGAEMAVARWGWRYGDRTLGGGDTWLAGYATTYEPEVVAHWMPLPSPPVEKT